MALRDLNHKQATGLMQSAINFSIQIQQADDASIVEKRAMMWRQDFKPAKLEDDGSWPTQVLVDDCQHRFSLYKTAIQGHYHIHHGAKKEHWVLIPHTFKTAQCTRFMLSIVADKNIELEPLAPWQKHSIRWSFTPGTSSKWLDEPNWRCCPQFSLVNHGQAECDALAILQYEELDSYQNNDLLCGYQEADKEREANAAEALASLPPIELSAVKSGADRRYICQVQANLVELHLIEKISNITNDGHRRDFVTEVEDTVEFQRLQQLQEVDIKQRGESVLFSSVGDVRFQKMSALQIRLDADESTPTQLLALTHKRCDTPLGFCLVVYTAPLLPTWNRSDPVCWTKAAAAHTMRCDCT